jgi:hypothetical protein
LPGVHFIGIWLLIFFSCPFTTISSFFLIFLWNTLSGPTPVMLSSPYSKNAQFATGQPLDSTIMSSSSAPSQGSTAASSTQGSTKRGSAHRANSSPYRQPPSRAARKQQQQRSESDDTDQSQTPAKPRTGRSKKPPHELLTEAEKKANHIASEQKRRQNIRVGFDQLVDIVPTLSQSHRSEAIILQKCKSSFSLRLPTGCRIYSTNR